MHMYVQTSVKVVKSWCSLVGDSGDVLLLIGITVILLKDMIRVKTIGNKPDSWPLLNLSQETK